MAKNGCFQCFIRTCILIFFTSNSIGFTFGGDVIVATANNPPFIGISNITIDDTTINLTPIPAMVTKPYGIVYDGIDSMVYWEDVALDTIEKYSVEDKTHDYFITDVDSNEARNGIEIDVINRKLYWVDDGGTSIYVINLDGTERKKFFNDSEIIRFDNLRIDSKNRYLYWVGTDINKYVKIERVCLDDISIRENITDARRSVTGGLSISKTGKLYWYDGGPTTIWECDLDGTNARQVTNSAYTLNTQVYGNYVYYNSAIYDGIGRADIETGQKMELYESELHTIFIYSEDRCNVDCLNGGVCVTSVNNTQSCQCPIGFVGPTCKRITGYCNCVKHQTQN
ncbi:low-density lipoprotein receptor-related protein 4-like [Anneissia japonica]|uniref:low-density lipoprotein receptor-related protein 4-like n=1 Tax=Anneissia japonica TaxID=1529436 RepID=UPI0014258464|nr:low-density lipoprotein receptor-related protein 4-like [Anneissia japonica]